MATVHPPPQFALLPRPAHAGDAAVVLGNNMDDDDSDGESVAESCPWPHPHGVPAATDDSCGSSTCCHGDEELEDDDGCSSCVEGDECSSYRYQELQEAAFADDEGGKQSGVWWERLAVATTALPSPASSQEEDPKRAAERQEEDRKFWEDCLATGYP